MSPLVIILIAVAIIIVVMGIVIGLVRRKTGRVIQRSHLRCPKCDGEFDYDWIPGVSFTAVRLGTKRYMACPKCHRWSTFDILSSAEIAPSKVLT